MSIHDLDKSSDKFIASIKVAYLHSLKQLDRLYSLGLSERHTRNVIEEIQRTLKEIDEEAYKWTHEVLPSYYNLSIDQTDKQIALLSVPLLQGADYVLHKQAVARAINDTYSDLAARTKFMSNEAKRIIRESTKEIIDRQLVTGESRRRTIPELRKKLKQEGIASFVASNGAEWTLDRYSEMLIRTKTRILTNEGTMDRLKLYQQRYPNNDNFDLVQISSHGAKDWCRHFEGRVFSISGKSEVYPPVSSLPNSSATLHPNCKHVFQPYIHSLRGEGQVASTQHLNKSVGELNKIDYHDRIKKR